MEMCIRDRRFENYNERDFGGKIRFEEGTSLNLSSSTLLFGTSRGDVYKRQELRLQEEGKGTYLSEYANFAAALTEGKILLLADSVSYTHLDVYKRQEVELSEGKNWVDKDSRRFGFRWFEASGIGDDAVFRLNGKRIIDVYKRQDHLLILILLILSLLKS